MRKRIRQIGIELSLFLLIGTVRAAGFHGKIFEASGKMVHTGIGTLTLDATFRLWMGDGMRALQGEGFWKKGTIVDSHFRTAWWTSLRGSTSVVEHLYPKATPSCAISKGVQIRGSWDSFALIAILSFTKPFYQKALTEGFLDPWRGGWDAQESWLRSVFVWSAEDPGLPERIEFYFDPKRWEWINKRYGPRNRKFWQPVPWHFKDVPHVVLAVQRWRRISGLRLPTKWLVEVYSEIQPFSTEYKKAYPMTLLNYQSICPKARTNIYCSARTIIELSSIKETTSYPPIRIPQGVVYSDFRAADTNYPGLEIIHFGGLQPGSKKWEEAVARAKKDYDETFAKEYGRAREERYLRKKRIWTGVLLLGVIGFSGALVFRRPKKWKGVKPS